MAIRNYINGEKNGLYKKYHINGQLWMIYNNVDGKINGEYKSYHYNRQLDEICNYIDGNKNGKYKKYSEDGILISHKIYENNEIIQIVL